MKKLLAIFILVATVTGTISAQVTQPEPQKKSFVDRLPKPLRWVARNWSAKDSLYCYDSFYNWAVHLQDNMSMEYLNVKGDGFDIGMNSRFSNKIGPYLGYQWLFLGTTWDFGVRSEGKRRSEFQLNINSQLFNIELIRRRTGGDFAINHFNLGFVSDFTDISSLLDSRHAGDDVEYSLTGVNINNFLNHKKFSNPAGYSNGAIQIRSAGSPIVGLGYIHQKLKSDIYENIFKPMTSRDEVVDFIDGQSINAQLSALFGSMTKTFDVKDLHLQLGYAYNLVFSRRLLLSVTAIASPGIKWMNADYEPSWYYSLIQNYAKVLEVSPQKSHEGMFREIMNDPAVASSGLTEIPDQEDLETWGAYSFKKSMFGMNFMGRASLTYNMNRWRAGIVGNWNWYKSRKKYYNTEYGLDNKFWSASVYVGYCFGRKKEFRYDGDKRNQYIRAALTQKQIEEVKDVTPKSNLGNNLGLDRDKYVTDEIDFDVYGCDLVKGPDGTYGSFELEDGYITEGMDPENRLRPGTVIPLDKDGKIEVTVGHKMSYRTGNWWKSQLDKFETNRQVYPDLLHYALKGKLTLYLRGLVFDTRKPVKIVIDDFYLCHGKDGSSFIEVGSKNLRRRSTYSVSGDVKVIGDEERDYRIFIEEGKGTRTLDVTISRVKWRNSKWMGKCPDDQVISRMCIPGTHDAGTSTIPESKIYWTAHTQNFPIIDQTKDGIRCFDIRLKEDMKFGHTFKCLESFGETMEEWDKFLNEWPSEFIIAMIGSDEGGNKWSEKMKSNFRQIIAKYPHRFVEDFDGTTRLKDVRGKILVIRRQEDCPYGKLLKFEDNAIFEYNGFHVADEYKQFKTRKKLASVEKHVRQAFEDEDSTHWYITFNSVSWSPRRHTPRQYAQGGNRIMKPLNQSLYEALELKDYTDFGIIMMDFYNNRGEAPKLVETIIKANLFKDDETYQGNAIR